MNCRIVYYSWHKVYADTMNKIVAKANSPAPVGKTAKLNALTNGTPTSTTKITNQIICGDNLKQLAKLPPQSVDLIYIDPPFNSGITQARHRITTVRHQQGDRIGFGGHRYKTIKHQSPEGYGDTFGDGFINFLKPRLAEAYRVLKPNGSFFLHIDYREVHYCKVELDKIFGRDCFINELIWAYDYGARSKSRWSAKHDNILWYAKDPKNYTYNYNAIDRIPYLAPKLVGKEKAQRGKTPTDVWWNTIVSPTGKEKTGYPTQKPLKILERIVKVHSNRGDVVLDFFAGSGTTGVAAAKHNRRYILVDNKPDAVKLMKQRLLNQTATAPAPPVAVLPA